MFEGFSLVLFINLPELVHLSFEVTTALKYSVVIIYYSKACFSINKILNLEWEASSANH